MDHDWVKAPRLSEAYKNGVKFFCDQAVKHAKDIRFIRCPCQKCLNIMEVNGVAELYEHLMCHGIDKTYSCWTYHGDEKGKSSSSNINVNSKYQFTKSSRGTSLMGETDGDNFGAKKDPPMWSMNHIQICMRS